MKNARRKERKIALVESMTPVAEEEGGVRRLDMVRPMEMGRFPAEVKPRVSVIGKPLTRAEIYELLKPHIGSNRQVNLDWRKDHPSSWWYSLYFSWQKL